MAIFLLDDGDLRRAEPRRKEGAADEFVSEYVLHDGGGLYAVVRLQPDRCTVRVYFAFLYSSPVQLAADGKPKRVKLGLGRYPALTLANARKIAHQHRETVATGRCPQLEADEAKVAAMQAAARDGATLGKLAGEWLAGEAPHWQASTLKQQTERLERHVLPYLGDVPLVKLTERDIATTVDRIIRIGSTSVAPRVRAMLADVFAHAQRQGLITRAQNFMLEAESVELGGRDRHKKKSHAAVTDLRIFADLLRDLWAYQGRGPVVHAALRLLPLLAQRPGQVAAMRWAALDLDAGRWTVTGHDRKLPGGVDRDAAPDFTVPLPHQAVVILRDLRPLTGRRAYVFPGARARDGHMVGDAFNKALTAAGWHTQPIDARDRRAHTAHGFRTTFQTLAQEIFGEHVGQAADFQLGHAPKHEGSESDLGTTYDRSTLLASRTALMQVWADFCDELRAGPTSDATSWDEHLQGLTARYRGISIIAPDMEGAAGRVVNLRGRMAA